MGDHDGTPAADAAKAGDWSRVFSLLDDRAQQTQGAPRSDNHAEPGMRIYVRVNGLVSRTPSMT